MNPTTINIRDENDQGLYSDNVGVESVSSNGINLGIC